MNAHGHEYVERVAHEVIGAAFEVSNQLGAGFLEKVDERALSKALQLRGLQAECQKPMPVVYKGEVVGEYFADLWIEDGLVVELKCSTELAPEHPAPCINYLKAVNQRRALLFNFQQPKVEFRRVVCN